MVAPEMRQRCLITGRDSTNWELPVGRNLAGGPKDGYKMQEQRPMNVKTRKEAFVLTLVVIYDYSLMSLLHINFCRPHGKEILGNLGSTTSANS